MSEQFLKVSRIRFDSAKSFDFKYHFTGEEFAHRHIKKKAGISIVRPNEPPPKSALLGVDKNDLWDRLNEGKRLPIPDKCPKCTPSEQQIFWRTFTRSSLKSIIENNGKGKWPDELATDQPRRLIESVKLENPGIIWLSQNPDLALNVGVSRGLTTGEPITLVGLNICKCDLENGVKIISPQASSIVGFSQLEQLDSNTIAGYPWATNGVIINRIPQKKFSEGVFYQVHLKLFSKIQKAIQKSRLSLEVISSDAFLRQLANMLGSVLFFLAIKDPEIPKHAEIDFLPRTFKLFLNQISNEETRSFL